MDAYQQHVVSPLLTVKNELFQTFRQKRSIVSVEDFEADKESLVRMLQDFRTDNASSKVVGPFIGGLFPFFGIHSAGVPIASFFPASTLHPHGGSRQNQQIARASAVANAGKIEMGCQAPMI